MSARQIVVVDCETTGLNPDHHVCVEVAWWNLSTGERGYFIPPHNVSQALAGADLRALQINRYIDRIADRPQDIDGVHGHLLAQNLDGNTLAGSNPAFDARALHGMYRDYVKRDVIVDVPTPHHRLLDLSAYAAGALGLDPTDLPGLASVCDRLYVSAPDHTAEGDVTAAGECFRELLDRAGFASALAAETIR